MKLQSCLLCETVQYTASDHLLVLNSAREPFVEQAIRNSGNITLAEDNIAAIKALPDLPTRVRHIAFHDYILHSPAQTIDVALMNLLYQPSNAWIMHGLQIASYALKPGGHLYVTGAKERGILSTARRMQEQFGNVETLKISKGQRVLLSQKLSKVSTNETRQTIPLFADSNLDEGTRLLLEAIEVHEDDEALDIGCGAGFLGLSIARRASRGHVTMVDASLVAVAATQQLCQESGLSNVTVLASDAAQAVREQRFDLVVTNPPFHQGGIQTTEIAARFIRDAAHVLRSRGRFYLVANRFLKYEPIMETYFKNTTEVAGNTRYKVLCAIKT